ncbi:kinase-like protein [Ceratobasidium sp. AG-I]|nr:kinase-like protein [Ceratobasidium sp. AG-I]
MSRVRDSIVSILTGLLSRPRISRIPLRNRDADRQDGKLTLTPTPALTFQFASPNPNHTPIPYAQISRSSLEVPTFNAPASFPMPSPEHVTHRHSPSLSPITDNEARAQASLSTQRGISLGAAVQELAPIPGIGPLVEYLTLLFKAVEKTRVNKEQWELLQGRCVMVMRIAGARVANHGGNNYPDIEISAALLKETMTNIGQRATYYNDMHEIFALFQYQSISEEIRGYFEQLDVCLCTFSYASDVAQMQWIDEFSAIQGAELRELEEICKLIIQLGENVDMIGVTNEQAKSMASQMEETLQKVLEDKAEIMRNQSTKTAAYVDARRIIKTIRTVTKLQPSPHILQGEHCILESRVPIKTGLTCDIYAASFFGGGKVAKKIFRIGMSDEGGVRKHAGIFLRDAKVWWTFRCDYLLPFYGIGVETFEGDRHFQLYMLLPLMKNFDAATYLKQNRNNIGINQSIMHIITDAARGLQYLHKCKPPVVHSGIRGDNILITDSGGGVLGGFGLTKVLQSNAESGNEKIPPYVPKGWNDSQRWMAPECFEDEALLQTPADIWGWAMTALELISGKLPFFQNRHPQNVMLLISTGKKPSRQNYTEFDRYALRPDELWTLLEKCWAMSPADRPTIDQVVAELEVISGMTDVK